MNTSDIASVVMLAFGGLYTGIVLAFAVERTNLWARMPIEQYAVDFRRSVFRVDPLQPNLASIAMIATAYYAWAMSGNARIWAAIGLAILLVIFAGSVAIAEPINSQFRKLPEGEAPQRAARLRDRWRRFHMARTAAAILAMLALAFAALSAN